MAFTNAERQQRFRDKNKAFREMVPAEKREQWEQRQRKADAKTPRKPAKKKTSTRSPR